MWMMGYNEELDSRKLRPLIPRPPITSSPCLARLHAPDHFFPFNHHLPAPTMAFQPSSVVVSSRWNPTPDQLRTLEELYRRGTRTPSADQIQHITAQLRRYGKIEGKNVFYWFQNHKARERQKRRRHILDSPSPSPLLDPKHDDDNVDVDVDDDGGRAAGFEVEQNNNNISTHCTTSPPEEENSRSTKAASMAQPYIHGWVQYDQRELQHHQQQQHMMKRNATWHTIPASATKGVTSCNNYQDYLNIFITHDPHRLLHPNSNTIDYGCDDDRDHHQTLELFPLRSENGIGVATANATAACTNQKLMMTNAAMDATSFPPNYQFFEFLPLKN